MGKFCFVPLWALGLAKVFLHGSSAKAQRAQSPGDRTRSSTTRQVGRGFSSHATGQSLCLYLAGTGPILWLQARHSCFKIRIQALKPCYLNPRFEGFKSAGGAAQAPSSSPQQRIEEQMNLQDAQIIFQGAGSVTDVGAGRCSFPILWVARPASQV